MLGDEFLRHHNTPVREQQSAFLAERLRTCPVRVWLIFVILIVVQVVIIQTPHSDSIIGYPGASFVRRSSFNIKYLP
jgi:hypothetical protein